MTVPEIPRFNYIIHRVYDCLCAFDIKALPLSPLEIITQSPWHLFPYTRLISLKGGSLNDVIHTFQSNDGFTLLKNGQYAIGYNDTQGSGDRITFTLAHEIGHVYLGHLEQFGQTRISAQGFKDKEYEITEAEADAFARNLLSPAPLYALYQGANYETIQKTFGISRSANQLRKKWLSFDSRVWWEEDLYESVQSRFLSCLPEADFGAKRPEIFTSA